LKHSRHLHGAHDRHSDGFRSAVHRKGSSVVSEGDLVAIFIRSHPPSLSDTVSPSPALPKAAASCQTSVPYSISGQTVALSGNVLSARFARTDSNLDFTGTNNFVYAYRPDEEFGVNGQHSIKGLFKIDFATNAVVPPPSTTGSDSPAASLGPSFLLVALLASLFSLLK
jgi:hypothetical protein